MITFIQHVDIIYNHQQGIYCCFYLTKQNADIAHLTLSLIKGNNLCSLPFRNMLVLALTTLCNHKIT